MSKETTTLKAYEFHGLEFSKTKTQGKSDCPICDGVNKFYVSLKDGMYHCKACGAKGNTNTFLSVTHDIFNKKATDSDVKDIRRIRDNVYSSALIREAGLCFNEYNEVLFPQKNPEAKTLSNLRKWSPSTKKLYNTPGCYSLYFAQWIEDPEAEIYLVEGEWDALALIQLMRRSKYENKYCVVSVPGANGFKETWAKRFIGRKVTVIFDNDHEKTRKDGSKFNPAKEGTEAVVSKLNGVVSKLKTIRWKLFRDSLSDGYDIRDVLTEAVKTKKSKSLLSKLLKACRTVVTKPIEGKQPIPVLKRTTFSEVVKDFESVYSVNQSFIDCLACCLSSIVSLKMKGNPLWLFVVAPPSCLSKGTEVVINRAGKSFRVNLEQLHWRYHGGLASGKKWRKDIETRIQYMAEDGTIRLKKIVDVISSGEKITFTVVTETGKQIRATMDHKFYTDNGWRRLKDIGVGYFLYTNQGRLNPKGPKKPVALPEWCGLKFHPYASKRTKRRSDGWKVAKHRIVMEAHLNKLEVSEYLRILRYDKKESKTIDYIDPKEFHVHHEDRDRKNFNLSNLRLMTEREHHLLHQKEDNFVSHVLEKTRPDKIVSIEEYGTEMTYDVSVEDEPHNFIANGICVHNSGKSTVIEAFEDSFNYTEHLSKLTATALVSGSRGSSGDDDEQENDPSMLGRLRNKVLFVKDFTAVLSMGANDQEKLFGVLRDAYDGSFKQHYGNGLTRSYDDLFFGIVAGVTNAIHGENRSSLGERFLKVNLLDSEFVEVDHIRKALGNIKENKNYKPKLQGSVIGFLDHLNSVNKVPELSTDSPLFEKLISLAQLVALVRTRVERAYGRDMAYRPEPEIGTRIATQLSKLGAALAIVYGVDEVNDDCYRVMQKVAIDSCVGYQMEVLNVVARSESGIPASSIAELLNLSINQIRKILDDMMQLNLVQSRRRSNNSGRRGNKINAFFLTDNVKELMRNAGLSLKGTKRTETPSSRTKRGRRNLTRKTK